MFKSTNVPQLQEAFEDAPGHFEAIVEGPTILTFWVQGSIAFKDKKWTDWRGSVGSVTDIGISLDPDTWRQASVIVRDAGPQTVAFGAHDSATRVAALGIVDDLKQQNEPVWINQLRYATAHPGTTSSLRVYFNSIGVTQAYVVKEGEKIAEMEPRVNSPVTNSAVYKWTIDSVSLSGTYTTRIENTYGVLENEIELFVADMPHDGFDTELLDYPKSEDNHMQSIWYTQTEDSHDGVDAVRWKWGYPENDELIAKLDGPAWVTFWWKNPDPDWNLRFRGGTSQSIKEQPEWSQQRDLADRTPYWLYWATRSETAVLDQLEIDYLSDNPFKEWLYPQLLEVDFEVVSADIETADYDQDQKSNLLEWALASDPLSVDPSPIAKVFQEEGQTLTCFSFESPAELGPYEIRLESSNDLTHWNPVNTTQLEEPIAGSTHVLRTFSYTHPEETNRHFLRISVAQAPNL